MSVTILAAQRQARTQGLAAIDADALLCHLLQKERSFLFAWPEHRLVASDWQQLQQLFQQRQQGMPIAYLTGTREFWSLPLEVDKSTLIPRHETETLVATVLQHWDEAARRCVDLGTGSGAIALALKHERPAWTISGVDNNAAAVALARRNARRLRLEVEFGQGNWCADIATGSVDIMVSNPPYISPDDSHLKQGDVRFEPTSALVAAQAGLADIKHIIHQAKSCLQADGSLYIEHGWQQAAAVRALLAEAGYHNIATKRDDAGHERVSLGCR